MNKQNPSNNKNSPRIRSEGLFFYVKNIKKIKLFFENLLTNSHFCGIIYTSKNEGGDTDGYCRADNKKAC